MRAHALGAGLILLLAWGATDARAQGLGDAAARERSRRQGTGGSVAAPVFDNEDLKRAAGPAGATEPKPGTDPGAAVPPPVEVSPSVEGSGQSDEERARLEAAVAAAEGRVRALEESITSLEARLTPASPTYVYGSVGVADPIAEERRVREELEKAQAELPEARRDLEHARRVLSESQRPTGDR